MRTSTRIAKSLAMMVAALSFAACGDGMSPSGGKKAEKEEDGGGVKIETDESAQAALAAFTETLYPLVTEHCASCHASTVSPNFAHTDAATAKSTIETSGLVSLTAVDSSRLIKRLTEQAHNCWNECQADGVEMQAAIQAWADRAAGAAEEEEFIKLASVPLDTAGEVSLKGGYNKLWVRAAAYSDGYGDRLAPLDEPRASQRKVMYRIPNTTPEQTFNELPDPKPQGGAQYFFDIPDSDTERYQLCFRVKTDITLPGVTNPVDYGTRVYSNINGRSRFLDVDLDNPADANFAGVGATVGTNYVWIPQFYQADPQSPTGFTPTAANLKPMTGSKQMRLDIYDTQPAIDLIALIGNSNTCSASATPNSGRVYGFQFDLTAALGKPAKLTLQYQKSADGLAQVFSRPTLELDDPTLKAHVEGIYVVINDVLDRQLNTFASVSMDVTGGALLSNADLIVPLGATTDKIGIYISKLSIVP